MVEEVAEECPCCGQDSNSDTSLMLTSLSVSACILAVNTPRAQKV